MNINCHRPKCNKKAKRFSGGIAVYVKSNLKQYIDCENSDSKGIIWLKISKSLTNSEQVKMYVYATYLLMIQVAIEIIIPSFLTSIFLSIYLVVFDFTAN